MALIYRSPALWEGFYLGGNVGGAWNTATVDDHYDYVGDPVSSNSLNGGGIIGGGQIGYNFQWGNIVFGPEAELGYLGLSGSRSVALNPAAGLSGALPGRHVRAQCELLGLRRSLR